MNVIHPIFLECLKYTDDIRLINILEDLALEISTIFTFDGDNIINNHEFINYKTNSPDTLIVLIQNSLNVDKVDCWSKIRKKDYKDLLIERYVLKSRRDYDLPLREARRVYAHIIDGLYSKTILAEDIILLNGDIDSINGVVFSDKRLI